MDVLGAVVAEGFARRVEPIESLADDADRIASAGLDMARAFHRGGRLLVFGNGNSATDALHISVEFVHPVIVGKRALPAFSLVGDAATVTGIARSHGIDEVFAEQLGVLGRSGDIALGVSRDGDCVNVRRGLEQARAAGMVTVALVGGDGGAIAADALADHCLVVRSEDQRVVKEGHVTLYHVLWELVHVFFEQPGLLAPSDVGVGRPDGLTGLYPFLYTDTTDLPPVLAAVAQSTRDKIAEIVGLRRVVAAELGERLAVCAGDLAEALGGGGTLFAFGNGGSSTDAQDIAHTFLDPEDGRVPVPALCLTSDTAVVTALSNDVGFDVVFARQIRAFGRPGDVAIGVSTSGGSANVLAALVAAKEAGMVTVGLSGYSGGRMAELDELDHLFAMPSSSVHRVQEVQTTLYHVLWEAVQAVIRQRSGPELRRSPPGRG